MSYKKIAFKIHKNIFYFLSNFVPEYVLPLIHESHNSRVFKHGFQLLDFVLEFEGKGQR